MPVEPPYQFTRDFGRFPLFRFWGPATSIAASQWIAAAARALEEQFQPTLQLVYLPHLDYVLQKEGPHGSLGKDPRELDTLCGTLVDYFQSRACRVIVLSEYGISQVSRPIHPNRMLREAGFLALKEDLGREYLDAGASRAFAVADHQLAHVYLRDIGDLERVKAVFAAVPGIEHLLDCHGKKDLREGVHKYPTSKTEG